MNQFSLVSKVIVITGAAGLLGRNHAIAVASAGGTPVLIDIDMKHLKLVADEVFERFNVSTKFFEVDITNESLVKSCCEEVLKTF